MVPMPTDCTCDGKPLLSFIPVITRRRPRPDGAASQNRRALQELQRCNVCLANWANDSRIVPAAIPELFAWVAGPAMAWHHGGPKGTGIPDRAVACIQIADGVAASALEFGLEGLYLSRRLNKDAGGGSGAARYTGA